MKSSTYLFDAVKGGDVGAVKRILGDPTIYGIDLNATENFSQGWTALHYAAHHSQHQIISLLLSQNEGRMMGFARTTCWKEQTALHIAAVKGDLLACKLIVIHCEEEEGHRYRLINMVDREKKTLLHLALQHGHMSIVNWLLSDGKDAGFDQFGAKSVDNETVLHLAVARGDMELFLRLLDNIGEESKQCILNARSRWDWSLLHWAAFYDQPAIIEWLLGEGRSLGFNEVLSRTAAKKCNALHVAVWRGNEKAFLAIANGCSPGERKFLLNATNYGWSMIHIAAAFPTRGSAEIMRWLLSPDDDGDDGGGGGIAGFDRKLLFRPDVYHGRTVLHLAVRHNSAEILKLLLSQCTDYERLRLFTARNAKGRTALFTAVKCGTSDGIAELMKWPEFGLIVNARDNEGMTFLHRLIRGGLGWWIAESKSRCLIPIILAHEAADVNIPLSKHE